MAHTELHEAELKALAEVCNLGMKHAAVALSQLTGKGVEIEVPRLQVLDALGASHLHESREVIVLQLQILGNVRGSILVLLPDEHARRILELLLGELPQSGAPFSEMERATLMEVGNILASACLNALGNALGMTLLPSVPSLCAGNGREILERAMEPWVEGEEVVTMDAMFKVSDTPCSGSIFVIPAPVTLGAMLTAMDK